MKEVGEPLRLQKILGHTSLEMVRRYVAMANVQRSLIAGAQQVSRNARRLQARKERLSEPRHQTPADSAHGPC